MPAPPIVLNRGPVSYTMVAIPLRGFSINASISQQSIGGDWSLTVSEGRNPSLPDPVDANDAGASVYESATVPFNEAPSEAEIAAKLQELVDLVYDRLVPTPAPTGP